MPPKGWRKARPKPPEPEGKPTEPVPMECADCDFRFVTRESLMRPACGLCGSTRRTRHRSLERFKDE